MARPPGRKTAGRGSLRFEIRRYIRRPSKRRCTSRNPILKFGMFYEIPVPRPWTPGKEHLAYQNVLEQARLGDRVGFHSLWTVEHHFLEEFSHCSNPEVLYGAIAAQTKTRCGRSSRWGST